MQTSPTHPELMHELDALTDTIDHLQFIREVIDRTLLSDLTKTELYQQIESIYSRLIDPQLYLAVIGEFSSGKSTLINALLRDELLKTSALVTTAAATYLYHDHALSVEVRLQGSNTGSITMRPGS